MRGAGDDEPYPRVEHIDEDVAVFARGNEALVAAERLFQERRQALRHAGGRTSQAPLACRKMRKERNRPARLDVLGEGLQHSARFPASAHEAADMDADGAAAGESDTPCRLVLDAEFERLGLAACDHVGSLGDHFGLDASTRDRTHEISVRIDQEQTAHRLRRGAPSLNDGGKREPPAHALPVNRLRD